LDDKIYLKNKISLENIIKYDFISDNNDSPGIFEKYRNLTRKEFDPSLIDRPLVDVIGDSSRVELPQLPEGVDDVEAIRRFFEQGEWCDLAPWIYQGNNWDRVASDPNYRMISEASKRSFIGAAQKIAEEMEMKGIHDYYSMGPSADVDIEMLKRFAGQKRRVRYHPIEINEQALGELKEEIREFLVDNPKFATYVELFNESPKAFEEVKLDGPATLAYQGGQLANNPNFMETPRRVLYDHGGLLVADLHIRQGDDGKFWLGKYDNQPTRRMFQEAVLSLVPDIGSQGGWSIQCRYDDKGDGPNKIGMHFVTDREIRVSLNYERFYLPPSARREFVIPAGSREMLPSYKFTEPELKQLVEANGFSVVSQTSVPIESGQNMGQSMTAIMFHPGMGYMDMLSKYKTKTPYSSLMTGSFMNN